MDRKDIRLLDQIERKLAPHRIDAIAKHTGFMARASAKITPLRLVKALCLLASSACSLRLIATTIAYLGRCTLSRQAVGERLNPRTTDFLRHLLFATLASVSELPTHIASGAFGAFRRVLIHDSTHIALPPSMASAFPGPKNQSRKQTASLKIHAVYDALAETFVSFSLSPFTRNDQAASSDILHLAQPGDLLLRDLGYFAVGVFRQLHAKGVHFLSRYRHGTALFLPDGITPFPLLRRLRQSGSLDTLLRIGADEKLLVRLVALPVPTQVANQRRRKLRANRDKRLHPSKEQLQLLDWQILITNVHDNLWDAQTVARLYALRWRIETLFKAWKSHFHIGLIPNGSPHQIEAVIYARLLWISLFHLLLFVPLSQHAIATTGNPISLLKLANFLTQNLWMLLSTDPSQHDTLLRLILYHCPYDKRKRPNHFQNILSLT